MRDPSWMDISDRTFDRNASPSSSTCKIGTFDGKKDIDDYLPAGRGVEFAGCRPAEWLNPTNGPACLPWVETRKPEKRVLAVEGSPGISNSPTHCFGLGFAVNESLDGPGLVQSAGRF